MARKSIKSEKSGSSNIPVEKIYPKRIMEWEYKTFGIQFGRKEVLQLARELLEALEKTEAPKFNLTVFFKDRKMPTLTISWVEREIDANDT